MRIGDREVGPGHPTFVVAEIGINHDGSLSKALEMVRAAAACGADAAKVQAFDPACFVTREAMWKGESQYEMFARYALSRAQVEAIAGECRKQGVIFFGTPDCAEHARRLLEAGAPVLKVGSDDLTNTPLIRELVKLGHRAEYAGTGGAPVPLILSTGMGDGGDIRRAVRVANRHQEPGTFYPLAVLHCVSLYPTPVEAISLWKIGELRRDFPHLEIGLSDHTESVLVPALAVAAGATIIEKHFTLDTTAKGPDHAFSMDPVCFKAMVNQIRQAEKAMSDGFARTVGQDWDMRPVARRSIVAARDLTAGAVLAEADLAYKRPGTGLMPYEFDKLVGRPLTRAVAKDEQIQANDVKGYGAGGFVDFGRGTPAILHGCTAVVPES